MGFIKWIGLFSGFAQTQSVLGAIAGFVIGSVIDSIWSGDSKQTATMCLSVLKKRLKSFLLEKFPPKRMSFSDLICIFAMSIVRFSCLFLQH